MDTIIKETARVNREIRAVNVKPMILQFRFGHSGSMTSKIVLVDHDNYSMKFWEIALEARIVRADYLGNTAVPEIEDGRLIGERSSRLSIPAKPTDCLAVIQRLFALRIVRGKEFIQQIQ